MCCFGNQPAFYELNTGWNFFVGSMVLIQSESTTEPEKNSSDDTDSLFQDYARK